MELNPTGESSFTLNFHILPLVKVYTLKKFSLILLQKFHVNHYNLNLLLRLKSYELI